MGDAQRYKPLFLVCGMHRSGTSLISHYFSKSRNLKILDDPEWAIEAPLEFLQSKERHNEMLAVDVVKCPRLACFIPELSSKFKQLRVIWCLRDPRDIFSSIWERYSRDQNTRLLRFPEIGVKEEGIGSFVEAYQVYAAKLRSVLEQEQVPVHLVDFQDFLHRRFFSSSFLPEENWTHTQRTGFDWEKQWGPTKHKYLGLRGAQRYTIDLTPDQLAILQPAVLQWLYLRERFEDQKNRNTTH